MRDSGRGGGLDGAVGSEGPQRGRGGGWAGGRVAGEDGGRAFPDSSSSNDCDVSTGDDYDDD